MVGVVLHKGGAALQTGRHHLHDAKQSGSFPVAFARKAVALLHQALYCQTRQLFQTVEIFKGGGKGVETALFQEALHAQLNARRVQHVLALVAVDLCRRRQAVAAFVLVHQRAHVAIADVIHHLHQIAHGPGIHGEAELDLRGDFIAVGDRHFTHVVAETHHFQVAGILLRDRLTHPGADTLLRLAILPVAGDHRVLLTHTRADEAELAAAVCGLVQVHKVHVDAVPRQGGVELGMELQQRFVEDRQAVDPHFCR